MASLPVRWRSRSSRSEVKAHNRTRQSAECSQYTVELFAQDGCAEHHYIDKRTDGHQGQNGTEGTPWKIQSTQFLSVDKFTVLVSDDTGIHSSSYRHQQHPRTLNDY